MHDRKAIQAQIDIDKKIRALIKKDAYNLNQIAAMLMVPLARVKKVRYGKQSKRSLPRDSKYN